MNQQDVVSSVHRWVASVVVELNLCPFAKRELVKERIRFVVTDTIDEIGLLQALETELQHLNDNPDTETTLLIHPLVLTNFADYNQFLEIADALIEQMNLDGIYQIASFHPQYQFADTHLDDAENYSNRSPYPLLHILREDSLEQVIEEYPDTASIPDQNIKLLNNMGANKLRALLEACFQSH